MEMRKVIARVANAAAMLLVLTGAGTSAPAEAQPSGRVVAIGDIHGASDRLHRILRQSRVMDRERRWTGGTATLVQTGDFTDRGAQVREVMDLLMRLEDSAPDGGGQVRVLLGNHETMNLTADVRDVTAAIFASFASPGADQMREDAYRRYVEYAARRRADLGRLCRACCCATNGCAHIPSDSSSTWRRWDPTDGMADGCGTNRSPPWSGIRSFCTAA